MICSLRVPGLIKVENPGFMVYESAWLQDHGKEKGADLAMELGHVGDVVLFVGVAGVTLGAGPARSGRSTTSRPSSWLAMLLTVILLPFPFLLSTPLLSVRTLHLHRTPPLCRCQQGGRGRGRCSSDCHFLLDRRASVYRLVTGRGSRRMGGGIKPRHRLETRAQGGTTREWW